MRFVIEKRDADSGRRQGLFQAAAALRDSGVMARTDHDHLADMRDWFDRNLERPQRLSLSPRPHAKAQALSWFKDDAIEHIRKMREFGEILERYGRAVRMITTRRPGYVVYEDAFQVVAYPFSETTT